MLTTGHQICEPPAEQRRLEAFAARRLNAQYISGDSSADLPLDTIPAGVAVGVIGLGLSFYDIMAQLTLGRGGRFVDDGHGRLRYLPSGREPLLVAGSRGGLPLPARGRNQKRPDHTYRPRILTVERIGQRRARGPLDFRTCVLPFLLAEIDLVYCETVARMRGVPDVPDVLDLPDLLSDVDQLGPRRALARLRERLGLTDLPALDLEALARPFVDREFASPQEYQTAVRTWIDDDLAAAAQGNADGPLKAALDVIRDVRGVLREAVDFGGLSAESHEDFLGWFGPLASFLSAGPPMIRLAQTRALLDAGVLVLAGPDARFETGPDGFVVRSPQVAGSARTVQVLLDARMPVPHLDRDTSELSRQLRARGVLTTWTNESGTAAHPHGWRLGDAGPVPPHRRERDRPGAARARDPHRTRPVVHPGRQRQAPGLDRLHGGRRRGRRRPADPTDRARTARRPANGGVGMNGETYWRYRRTEAHQRFREARDLLLELRTDPDRAAAEFRWPRAESFNWALEWFDVIAADNAATALELLPGNGKSPVRMTFQQLSARSDTVAVLAARPRRPPGTPRPDRAGRAAGAVGDLPGLPQARRSGDPLPRRPDRA